MGITKSLMIAGHQRSGTTMLQRLVNTHPQIAVTSEFRQFMTLDRSYALHVYSLNKPRPNKRIFPQGPTKPDWRVRLYNLHRALQYSIGVFPGPCNKVRQEHLVRSMHGIYPRASYVGDKYPDYIYEMHRFVNIPDMVRLVICRDPRDVTASSLEMVDEHWKHHEWSKKFNSPTKVAKRWVEAMQITSECADYLYVIRYEDLVINPKAEVARLADFLQLDHDLFNTSVVRDTSVGSYKHRLTSEQIAEVEFVTGPFLQRFGYC